MIKVLRAKLALKVTKVHKVKPVLKAIPVIKVLKVKLVLKVTKGIKVMPEMMVSALT